MRRLFTSEQSGLSSSALRWGEHTGQWRRLACCVYGDGPTPPTPLDLARAKLLASGEVARDVDEADRIAADNPVALFVLDLDAASEPDVVRDLRARHPRAQAIVLTSADAGSMYLDS